MEAIFIIPTMVSSNISDRIVPFLSKAIERQVILNNMASIRTALLLKYRRKSGLSEEVYPGMRGFDFIESFELSEAPAVSAGIKTKTDKGILKPEFDFNVKAGDHGGRGSGPTRIGGLSDKVSKIRPDETELPKGITFFNTMGLEPTYVTIPMEMKGKALGGDASVTRDLMVGFKCTPYKVDGVENILNLIDDNKGRSDIHRYFLRKWRSVQSKIPFTIPSKIRKGSYGGKTSRTFKAGELEYSPQDDILFAPDSQTLANPKKLKKMMSMRKSSRWSTVVVFSSVDLEGRDTRELMNTYKDLVDSGWGDIVIVNEAKESAAFCNAKMKACSELTFTYMRNLLKIDNVLDAEEVARWTGRGSHSVTLRKAFMDCTLPAEEGDINLTESIDKLFRG